MAVPTGITEPPAAPTRSNPATFEADADAFVAWIVQMLSDWAGLSGEAFFAIQESSTDTSTGKILTVGAFGLGKITPAFPGGDLDIVDNSIGSGFYRYSTTASDTGGPAGVTVGHVIHQRRTSGGGETQLMVVEGGTDDYDDAGNLFSRSRVSGSWGDWERAVQNRHIVGTVAQSGGVPTGSILEEGSNGNGEYVRYADGTQICKLTNFSTTSGAATTWAYPAAFGSAPSVTGCCSSGTSLRSITTASRGTTTVDIHSFDDAGADTVSPACDLIAIGRWY